MALFVALLCIIASIWLLLQFAPQVHLEVFIEDVTPTNGCAKVTVAVHNTSRARMTKQTILLQSLAYTSSVSSILSDNVPFKTAAVRHGEEPLEWREPRELFKGTRFLFPGETLTTECLIPVPENATLIHVGLQFNAEQGHIESAISRFFTLNDSWETATLYCVGKDN